MPADNLDLYLQPYFMIIASSSHSVLDSVPRFEPSRLSKIVIRYVAIFVTAKEVYLVVYGDNAE